MERSSLRSQRAAARRDGGIADGSCYGTHPADPFGISRPGSRDQLRAALEPGCPAHRRRAHPCSARHAAGAVGAGCARRARRQPLTGLPLTFLPNAGQADPAVRFQTQGLGGSVAFTANELIVRLASAEAGGAQSLDRLTTPDPANPFGAPSAAAVPPAPVELRVQFDGANPAPELVALEPLPGRFNYYAGSDPSTWRTDVPMYSGVAYRDLYPGVTLQYYGASGQLKGTCMHAAGADPDRIRWRYAGAGQVALEAHGRLSVSTPEGAAAFAEQAPVAWQTVAGERRDVPVSFVAYADGAFGFTFPAGYDPDLPLTVDPTIEFSTFVNGNLYGPVGAGLAVDGDGNVLVTGFITCFCQTIDDDLVVYKLSPDGKQLLYMSVIGGSVGEYSRAIAVSAAGYAYVTGYTYSVDFPTTPGAFQLENAGNLSCAQYIYFNIFDCARLPGRAHRDRRVRLQHLPGRL